MKVTSWCEANVKKCSLFARNPITYGPPGTSSPATTVTTYTLTVRRN